MKKILLLLFILSTIAANVYSQTIVATYPFPNYSQYNSFWGITSIGDTLRIATDNNGSIYKVSKTGVILDSMTTPFTFNHGLVWDGTGFWVAEDFRTAGARLYKINTSGVRIDSIALPSLIGGASGGVGDIALDGNSLWFSIYSPDFTSYPFAYAYKMDLSSRLITDTIPLRGRQVQGITVKGDTVFYVNDYFHTTPGPDPERIYAYRKSTGDTLFSFACPDPDGDGNPRGLHWDGQYLWLVADRVGNNMFLYKTLYKYSLATQGNPVITTGANNLDFGNTIIGTTTDRNLSITNTGTAKLIISNFNFTSPRFTINPSNVPDTVNAGQTKNYTVKFTPTAFDTISAQLQIMSNDGVTPMKIIALKGKGVHSGSYITASVPSINYSSRRVNSLCGGYFYILNKGTTPLTVNSITFNSQRFRVDTIATPFPMVIDTQKTRQIRIWFNPNSVAAFSDTAKINSNAVNAAVLPIPLSGSGVNNTNVLGNIYWEGNIPDNPNTSSDNYKIVSMKQIPDVNYDGVNDVVVSTDNYWTICYNGNSSVTDDTLWKFNTRQSSLVSGSVLYEDAMQVMNDVNSDGISDVVIGTGGNNELVYALSGKTGKLIWTYGDSSLTGDGDVNSLCVTKDYNGDGIKDVLLAASGEGEFNGRHAGICVNGKTAQMIFYAVQNAEFTHAITATSLGMVVDNSTNAGVYGLSGYNNTGNFVWSAVVPSVVWSMKEAQDINTDGNTDIISFSGFNGTISAISSLNGANIWSQNTGASIDGNIRLMDDLAGDGFLDIVASGPRNLYRIDSRTSTIIWSSFLDGNYIHGVDQLSDITGNGVREIVAGTQNSNLYVVNGDSGRILFTYNFGSATTNTVEQVCALKSIDGNVSSEFLGGSRTGKIICFSGGPDGIVGISNNSAVVPDKFSLSQNYPNPFNPVTKIKFDLPAEMNNVSIVKLVVYDALGREAATLVNEHLTPGSYEADFDGAGFSSGVYFYKLSAGNFVETKRMVLVK